MSYITHNQRKSPFDSGHATSRKSESPGRSLKQSSTVFGESRPGEGYYPIGPSTGYMLWSANDVIFVVVTQNKQILVMYSSIDVNRNRVVIYDIAVFSGLGYMRRTLLRSRADNAYTAQTARGLALRQFAHIGLEQQLVMNSGSSELFLGEREDEQARQRDIELI
ncbi:hypothetical protein K474DRAFT_1700094 [Panus rudis PR-1116 ss-1]|nr:hypothetical protein K474DRAFT_1700094 [Panus rudis PR-1116 ss-1]